MKTLYDTTSEIISKAILKAFPEISEESVEPEITQSTQEHFGHYQCNNALKLAKVFKKSPRDVAAEIVKNLDSTDGKGFKLFSKIEIAGPGFINFTFNEEFLSAQLNEMLKDTHLGINLPSSPEKVIVEFSSPNIAKELHVGHLRSTIIGDCLARIFEFLGYDVMRLNHVGDWGTQFGMLIAYLKEFHSDVLSGKQKTDLVQLMQWYKESKKKFDEDPDFKKRSQLEVVKLQGGDEVSLSAWERICDISREAFNEIYKLLDVRLEERGESFYNPMLKEVVDDLDKKGLVTVSEGAKCIFLEGFTGREGQPLPMIIQKSDGGYNYDTTDMAAMYHRITVEKAQRIIVVTDLGQSLHFQMIAKACEKAGYLDPAKTRFDHVPFGVVLGPDGKKFKTRSGETEKLIDLLTEAVKKAREILEERKLDFSSEELCKVAEALGVGAVKYADLSCNRVKDYVFSYDRMLKFEGNTAAFLLYAYVRIHGIKRKVNRSLGDIAHAEIKVEHPSEISLGVHLRQFEETLQAVAKDLLPNRLTDYLYQLAEKFNAFFRDCRVEGSPQESNRLLLCALTEKVLKKGLELLGLKTVERM